MPAGNGGAAAWRWHQALAYALTGERHPELGEQDEPDLDVVVAALAGRPLGAFVVPADLREGLGAARLAALVTDLRTRLASSSRPVLVDRAPDADERRLLADVPPHHGT